jgi:hypothetical protein
MFKNEDGYTTTGWDYEKDMPIFAKEPSTISDAVEKGQWKRAGGIDKQTISYIVWSAGLAAGIGGIFYAHKKGYGGWGKFGMFILFSIPFNITAGVIRLSDKK